MTLSDYLTEHFRMQVIAGAGGPSRVVRFVAPEVETTGGGKQARQIVQLVRKDGAEPPLVCGFIDIGLADAQMRGFDALASLQRERNGTELTLSRGSYEEFLNELKDCLDAHDIGMRISNEITQTRAPVLAPPPPAAPKMEMPEVDITARELAMLGVGIAAGLVLGALIWSPASPF